MSPFEQIEAEYRKSPQEQSFFWYVDWHHRYGFVYGNPSFFIMGRPVVRADFNPSFLQVWNRNEADAWYIHAMSGDMKRAWDILPYPLGYLGWERIQGGKRDLRWYRTEDIRRLSRNEPLAAIESLAEMCV